MSKKGFSFSERPWNEETGYGYTCTLHNRYTGNDVTFDFPAGAMDDWFGVKDGWKDRSIQSLEPALQGVASHIEHLRENPETVHIADKCEEAVRSVCGEFWKFRNDYAIYDEWFLRDHDFQSRDEFKAYVMSHQEEALQQMCKDYDIHYMSASLRTLPPDGPDVNRFIDALEAKHAYNYVPVSYAAPCRFEKDGKPYLVLSDTTPDATVFVAPESCYDGKGKLAYTKDDGVACCFEDPEHTLVEFLSKDAFPETYRECMENHLHGGRNGFLNYLDKKEHLELPALGLQEARPLLVEGAPVTRETVHEAGVRVYGGAIEEALEEMDTALGGNNPVIRKEILGRMIDRISEKLCNNFVQRPEDHVPKTKAEGQGFYQKDKREALEVVGKVLASPAFDNPDHLEERVAGYLSSVTPPYSNEAIQLGVQASIFSAFTVKPHNKKVKDLAAAISRTLKDAESPEEIARVVQSLALGGEDRKEEIRSILDYAKHMAWADSSQKGR